jgi:archaellum biogenesis protein FlaJ (TadC family)
VTPRSRIAAFGSAGLLVVAGVVCAIFVNGLTGQVLMISLLLAGLGGALLLVFLEVGMSEDRQRARDEERRRERAESRVDSRQRLRLARRPRRPD